MTNEAVGLPDTATNALVAPWTPEQVSVLNRYQHSGFFHPFTCCETQSGCRDRLGIENDDRLLVATLAGWICPTCDYTQNWCWPFMANPDAPWMKSE